MPRVCKLGDNVAMKDGVARTMRECILGVWATHLCSNITQENTWLGIHRSHRREGVSVSVGGAGGSHVEERG